MLTPLTFSMSLTALQMSLHSISFFFLWNIFQVSNTRPRFTTAIGPTRTKGMSAFWQMRTHSQAVRIFEELYKLCQGDKSHCWMP